jgi:hypothetical protein
MRAVYRIVWNSLPLQAVDPGPTGSQSLEIVGWSITGTGRRDLDDVGSSLGIEKLRAAKMVEEGLAVVAVAHDPVHGVGGDTCDQPANVAAATGQRSVLAHFLLRGGSPPG